MPQREHLRRLDQTWSEQPIYFLTICCAHRQKILAGPVAAKVLVESWHAAHSVHGWRVGRYVIMPDHVHFFATPDPDAKPLSGFIRDWKKWTTRQLRTTENASTTPSIIWQPEFFDHVLRSSGSYEEKWRYVVENPVRAGLVASAEAWPYAGECLQISGPRA